RALVLQRRRRDRPARVHRGRARRRLGDPPRGTRRAAPVAARPRVRHRLGRRVLGRAAHGRDLLMATAELSRSLRARHVTMISIGGIIGAGLFVGSSVAIAAAGPAIIVSYVLTGFLLLLIMRMLGEMAVDMPQVRSFTEFTRMALGNWAGF